MASRPEYDYTIGWRPFQLNPEMAPAGMARDKYLAEKFGDRERSAEVYKQVRAAGRAERIAFNFGAIRRQPNTFDSHRLIRWSALAGRQEAVVEELFQRYFMAGADIGDRDQLLDVAEACGLERQEISWRFAEDADRELVRDEEKVARQMGVSGVPCFIIDQKFAVSGAQDPSVLINLFDLTARESAARVQAAGD